MINTTAFIDESLPFFGELGLGFERDFIAGKIVAANNEGHKTRVKNLFFTLVPFLRNKRENYTIVFYVVGANATKCRHESPVNYNIQ